MNHGRDHQEREQKVKARRANSPEEEGLQAGRRRGTPPQGVVGAQTGRFEQPGQTRDGSEVAPTARAEQRERIRHQEERMIGRRAAGIGDNLRDRREGSVSRAELDEAARMADRATTGPSSRGH